ncbi:hypothetical protein BDF20DRAFT_875612 [Mycotypha africana]|uniref:uncharacterized protein n=1 Tax=Mycotypha africana TaxID=64632 RepID=UPI002301E0C8|nr:uncharacterized protein BDF20DRAFT_875612 [Mycotypha africana]KAI8977578.1 hypothetical protein BDF20DRAFT_875612 [Mycotypha africana]
MSTEKEIIIDFNYLSQISREKSQNAILRGILPGHVKALLIGRKGCTIEGMKQHFKVKINIEGERMIQIGGQPENIAKAWTHCLKLVLERLPFVFTAGRISISFMLTTAMIHCLLAVNAFEKIASESGVEIRIHRRPLTPDCTEHIVKLSVAEVDDIEHSLEKAVHNLCTAIACNPKYALSFPGTKFYYSNNHDEPFLAEISREEKKDDLVFNPLSVSRRKEE